MAWLKLISDRLFRYNHYSGKIIGVDWQQVNYFPPIQNLNLSDNDRESLAIFASIAIPILNENSDAE